MPKNYSFLIVSVKFPYIYCLKKTTKSLMIQQLPTCFQQFISTANHTKQHVRNSYERQECKKHMKYPFCTRESLRLNSEENKQ